MQEINYDDTGRTIARLDDGDIYAVELASVWEGDRCVGTVIIASSGPLHCSEVGLKSWAEMGSHPSTVFHSLRNMELWDDDVDWLQEQESFGSLTYPLGYAAATIDALLCK